MVTKRVSPTITSCKYAILTIFLSFGWVGCAIHPYNNEKHSLMESGVKKVYEEDVKLVEVVNTERQNLNNLLDQQLEVVKRNNIAKRDLNIFHIIDNNKDSVEVSLFAVTQIKLTNLYPHFPEKASEDISADLTIGNLRAAFEELEQYVLPARKTFYIEAGKLPPSYLDYDDSKAKDEDKFPIFTKLPNLEEYDKNKLESIELFYNNYRDNVMQVMKKLEIVNLEGKIPNAFNDWKSKSQELSRLEKKAKKAKSNYEAAIKKYKTAKDQAIKSSDINEKFNKAVSNVKKALELLEGSGIFGEVDEAETKLQAVNKLLESLAIENVEGVSPDEDKEDGKEKEEGKDKLSNAIAVARTIPSLVNQIGLIAEKANTPLLSSLLIQQELQKERLEYAKRKVNRANKRVELYKERFESLLLEATFYLDIIQLKNDINDAQKEDVAKAKQDNKDFEKYQYLNITLYDLLSDTEVPILVKRYVYEALFAYASALGIANSKTDEVYYQLINLSQIASLDASETALKRWNSLIATPINQLTAYHASGFKAHNVADIIVKGMGVGALGIIAGK